MLVMIEILTAASVAAKQILIVTRILATVAAAVEILVAMKILVVAVVLAVELVSSSWSRVISSSSKVIHSYSATGQRI